jgi:hypothetical protein
LPLNSPIQTDLTSPRPVVYTAPQIDVETVQFLPALKKTSRTEQSSSKNNTSTTSVSPLVCHYHQRPALSRTGHFEQSTDSTTHRLASHRYSLQDNTGAVARFFRAYCYEMSMSSSSSRQEQSNEVGLQPSQHCLRDKVVLF